MPAEFPPIYNECRRFAPILTEIKYKRAGFSFHARSTCLPKETVRPARIQDAHRQRSHMQPDSFPNEWPVDGSPVQRVRVYWYSLRVESDFVWQRRRNQFVSLHRN